MTGSPQEIKILVIDDESAVRESCAEVLSRRGFSVDAAADGESGLAAALASRPNLVILDLKMPDMGGFPVLEEIKRQAPTTACVVITAYATVSTMREALRRGAQDFLPKPFTPEELMGVVDQALTRQRLCLEEGMGSGEERGLRNGLKQIMNQDIRPVVAGVVADLNQLGDGLDSQAGPQGAVRTAARRLEELLSRLEGLATD